MKTLNEEFTPGGMAPFEQGGPHVHMQAGLSVAVTKEINDDDRKPKAVPGIQIGEKRLIVQGRLLKVARLKDEWNEDLGDPEAVINGLRALRAKPDLFTFWQRLPDITPSYSYYHEAEAISALPLSDFKHWWEKQIKTDTRKKAKRPEKRGVEIKVVELDDEFVRGVMAVFNETPIRRGRPFRHYGKDFDSLKELLSRDLSQSKFIGAYSEGSLVGLVKLVYAERRFANPGLIVSKIAFRSKYVNNALLAKAVEVCTQDEIPYLTYTHWRRGSQAEFLARNGFQKTLMPRYWVPLTSKGATALRLGLHRNIRTYIPEGFMSFLLDVRGALYRKWYKGSKVENEADSD